MLTQAQYAALKADIQASPDVNTLPLTNAANYEIRDLYNLNSTTDVWNPLTPVANIVDAIDGSKYTPTDTADGTVVFTNRMLACQTKQISLQTLIQGRDVVNAEKANVRAWLRDAVIQIPSGAGGVNVVAAGSSGSTALSACTRKATRFEKIYVGAPVSTGSVSASLLTIKGPVSADDIAIARELP